MPVVLLNHFHAGDIVMSRALIRRVRPLLVDLVPLQLRCKPKHRYLWADLGLPFFSSEDDLPSDARVIDLWFAHGGDLLGVTGMTHATQVTSYNRQARAFGLPELDPDGEPGLIDFAAPRPDDPPGILLENGPVLSGQPTFDLNPHIAGWAAAFPDVPFYCAGKRPPGAPSNVHDVSGRNLIEISALSEVCRAMVARLSAPFVVSLTRNNVGRLPRLVLGRPIGCPIWDERDVCYFESADAITEHLREVLQ